MPMLVGVRLRRLKSTGIMRPARVTGQDKISTKLNIIRGISAPVARGLAAMIRKSPPRKPQQLLQRRRLTDTIPQPSSRQLMPSPPERGEVPEWPIGRHWKCRVPSGTVGSNPTLSVGPLRAATSSRNARACGVFSIADCPVALKLPSKLASASSIWSGLPCLPLGSWPDRSFPPSIHRLYHRLGHRR